MSDERDEYQHDEPADEETPRRRGRRSTPISIRTRAQIVGLARCGYSQHLLARWAGTSRDIVANLVTGRTKQ